MSWTVKEFGIHKLNALGLDGETYIDYILQLINQNLADSKDVESFLLDSSVNEEEALKFIEQMKVICLRGHLLEEEIEELKSTLSPSKLPPPAEEEQEDDPLSFDITSYEMEVDWMMLVDSLENHLLSYYGFNQEFSPYALMQALYKSYYQIDYAAQLLLNANQKLNECKPCRHLLQDRCLRKDCHFDHDLKSFPCRYWLFSVCANTNQSPDQPVADLTEAGSCVFLHDLPDYQPASYLENISYPSSYYSEEPAQTPGTQQQEPVEEQPEEEQFPSLGSQLSSSSSNKNNKVKINPYLSAIKTQKTTSDQSFPLPSSSSAAKKTNSGVLTVINQKKVFSELLEENQFLARPRRGAIDKSHNQSGSLRVKASEWVESGDVIRQDYEKLREEARQFAIARNKLLQEATQAYMRYCYDWLSSSCDFMNFSRFV
jgi:hypothetical protein